MKSLYRLCGNLYSFIPDDNCLFTYKNKWIVKNNKTMGWVILDDDEISAIFNIENEIYEKMAIMLYRCGIIKKNHQYICLTDNNYNKLIYIELNVINRCNLKCKYCVSNFNYNIHQEVMNRNIASSFCSKLKEYLIDTSIEIYLEFSGGEPLLNIEVIYYIMDELAEFNNRIFFVIQTNATLLNEKNIFKLSQYKNIEVAVSIDGYNDFHNSNRVYKDGTSTLNVVKDSIGLLKKHNIHFNIVIVVNRNNINEIDKIVQWLIDDNITYNFSLLPLQPFGYAKNMGIDIDYFAEKIIEIHKKILYFKYTKNGINIFERNIGNIMGNMSSSHRTYMCNRSPCGAGRNIISIAPNGNIYPCNGFQSNEKFLISNIQSEMKLKDIVKSEIISELNKRQVNTIEECDSCNYNVWCNGGCTSNAYLQEGNLLKKDIIYCTINRKIIESLLDTIISDDTKFMDYLYNLSKPWRLQ